MKKFKKVLGLIISLCLVMQLIPHVSASLDNSQNYIINDQFATGTDGWVAGEVHSSKTKAALSNASRYTDRDGVTANGLLKIDFAAGDGSWIWNANAAQSAYREFDTPYTYKAGTNIIVKTRILQTCTGDGATFRFLHNSPNSATVNSISGNNEAPDNRPHSDGSYYYNDYLLFNTRKNGSGSDVCYPLNYHKEEDGNKGTILHSATADNLKNRWIDVEMVINGTGNTAIIKATANGVTETGTVNIEQEAQVYMNKYGTNGSGNPNQSVFSALESFTIQQGVTTDAVTVYVDYIEVYEQSYDYILNDQFSSGTDGWVSGRINKNADPAPDSAELSTVASYTDANGVTANGVLRVDMTNARNEYSIGGQPNIFKAFDTPYTYKKGVDLVIKTRVLHTANSAGKFYLMHNRQNTIDTVTTGASITADNSYRGHYVLFGVRGDQNEIIYPNGFSGDTVTESTLLTASNIANKWIDVEMVIDGVNDQMTIKTTVDGQTATQTTSIKQPDKVYIRDGADPATGWTTPLKPHWDTLNSLTFMQRLGDDTLYIDYIQVYEAPYVINDQFATGTDGWVAGEGDSAPTLSKVASYTDKDGVTANGLLKIEFTGTGGDWDSKLNQTAHRAFGAPYTYKDDVNVVIKTRILQTDASGTFSFLHNKPNTATTGEVAEEWQNATPYDAIRPGAYYYNDYLLFHTQKAESSSDLRYYKKNTHDLPGNILNTATADNLTDRWIDVTMIIDGKKNNMTITATANGVTETATNIDITQPEAVYRNKYGTDADANPNQAIFDALESLSIQQRESSNTVYVDYVVVCEQSKPLFVDSLGNEITALSANTTVYPKFIVNPDASESSYLISARYEDDALADCVVEFRSDTATESGKYTDSTGYELGADISNVVLRAFIWEASSFSALCKNAEIR